MLVIIHGWSDDYKSFRRLARLLRDNGVGEDIREIHLGDYLTLDDEVTFDDIVTALDAAWDREPGLSREPRSVDVVVHSTGGLVIRQWLTTRFEPTTAPIRRLLMLAPANFGSPLAHTGRTFIGRVVKGWKGKRLFHTGARILSGLELASPYSWGLAGEDCFGSRRFYGPDRILCTVLVGNSGYGGISAMANRPGSDGTVRVSTANLAAVAVDLDFSERPDVRDNTAAQRLTASRGEVAFGVMDGENHSTIAGKDGGPRHARTLDWIVEALQVEESQFRRFRRRLAAHTDAVMHRREQEDDKYFHGYQNTVFYVEDQYGTPVEDYVIELYVDETTPAREERSTRLIQEAVITDVHPCRDAPAYRSMLVDCTALYRILDNPRERLKLSITACPELSVNRDVGFRSYTEEDIGFIAFDYEQTRRCFQPNRTALFRLKLKREQSPRVFRFKRP